MTETNTYVKSGRNRTKVRKRDREINPRGAAKDPTQKKMEKPLIKRYLPSSLKLFEEQLTQIINKDRSYMVMATKRLKFLDVS